MKTTEELEEIYDSEPYEWIALWKNRGVWVKITNPSFIHECHYQLIHIKHKDVLDAYLADDKVEIKFYLPYVMCTDDTELEATWEVDDNFIENYNPDLDYRLKETPMKWNGYYIKASQETYDKLINEGYKAKSRDTVRYRFFEVDNDKLYGKDYLEDMDTDKQFYLINGEFTEEKEDGTYTSNIINISIPTIEVDEAMDKQIDKYFSERNVTNNVESVLDLDTFNEMGFETPDFEGKILQKIKEVYIGYVIDNGEVFSKLWALDGTCSQGELWNLTHIKKHWYENEANFPALLIWDSGIDVPSYRSTISKDSFIKLHRQGWRLATKEELMSLYSEED